MINGATVTQSPGVGSATTDWQIDGTGDFNGDGKADILWRHSTGGQVVLWVMNGATVTQSTGVGGATTDWQVASLGDLNGDGDVDIGDVSNVAYMVVRKAPEDPAADFNGNGKVDIGDAAKIACFIVGKIGEL